MNEEKNTKKIIPNDGDFEIKEEESSIVEFTKRPLPNDKQLRDFDKYIEHEVKEEDIKESLNAIYNDENGQKVNVKKLEIKKKRGFLFWLFFLAILGLIGYGLYYSYENYYKNMNLSGNKLVFDLEGNTEVTAGEEYFYTINYKNESDISLKNVQVEVTYPKYYIPLDSVPLSSKQDNIWLIDSIAPNHRGKISIKGKMIGPKDSTGLMSARVTYVPENFSSEFQEEASLNTMIKSIGIDFDFDYSQTAFIGEDNLVKIKFEASENNFIKSFRLNIPPQENLEFLPTLDLKDDNIADYQIIRPGVWQINNVADKEQILPIKFKFTKKNKDTESLKFNFEQIENNKNYSFLEQNLDFNILKNDLNMTMILNGSKDNQGAEIGEKLDYSIVYKNGGESPMNDVAIMAVLESDYLDWKSLTDQNKGIVKSNKITWTKDEIPELASIGVNAEGVIDFSINVAEIKDLTGKDNFKITSYAQYKAGGSQAETEAKSNTIVSQLNSDLNFTEQVRYFDANNIPVGTGPLPPEAGQTTTYKVFWELNNTLHELNNIIVSVKLPPYVGYNDKTQSSAGNIVYDKDCNTVTWEISRLPNTVAKANADFSISLTPTAEDKNKILVLLPQALVTAVDAQTKEKIEVSTKAKTTQLEDDEIANNDGRVK